MTIANVLNVLLALFSAYALLKFAVFFGLSYSRRRAMLDRAYGAKASATKVSDIGLLIVVIFLSLLLYMRGIEHVSFVTGLLVGMTLIQLYFHKFSLPLSESESPPHSNFSDKDDVICNSGTTRSALERTSHDRGAFHVVDVRHPERSCWRLPTNQ